MKDEMIADTPESGAQAAARHRAPWTWLLLIVLLGLAVRLALFAAVYSDPQFQWVDADHYMGLAQDVAGVDRPLADRIVKAASYEYTGSVFYLPPLYTLMLAVFALFPFYPLNAAIGQAVLGAASALSVYVIGRQLHSKRTGLVAAALYALWPAFLTGTDVFTQEQLYVPLVLAGLALLAWVFERDDPRMHMLTGIVFGAAALTRLMILFYVLLIPAFMWLAQRNRRVISRQVVPLLVGMAIVVVPYSVFLSVKTGEAMLVENHGGFDMRSYAGRPVVGKPTLALGLQVLVDAITHKPGVFVTTWLDYVRLLFKPNGMRWVERLGYFSTRSAALFAVGLRILCDVSYVAAIVLTPVGLLLARRRSLSAMLITWVLVLAALTALSGTAGARYRSPAEPMLLVFAAVAVTTAWTGRARVPLLAATAVGVFLAAHLVAQVPHVGQLPPYGLRSWSPVQGVGESTRHGDIGVRLIYPDAGVEVVVEPLEIAGESVRVEISVDGHVMFDRTAQTGEVVRLAWTRPGMPYLRIRARGDRTARPVPFRFTVVARPSSRVALETGRTILP